MKNKYIVFFLILIVISILVYYINQDTELLEVGNQSLNNSQTNNIILNKQKSSNEKVIKDVFENNPIKFFNNLKFSQKEHYFTTCFRVGKTEGGKLEVNVEDIDVLIKNFMDSQNSAGYHPSDAQLKIVKNMFEQCKYVAEYKDMIFEEMSNSPYFDENGIGYLYQDLKEILRLQGAVIAIKHSEENLLSPIQQERLDAFQFLINDTTWLDSINDSLDLQLNNVESRSYMNTALSMMGCDYGIVDCGVNSVMMYGMCLAVADTCGMTGKEFFNYTIPTLSSPYIDQYVLYLHSLGIGLP